MICGNASFHLLTSKVHAARNIKTSYSHLFWHKKIIRVNVVRARTCDHLSSRTWRCTANYKKRRQRSRHVACEYSRLSALRPLLGVRSWYQCAGIWQPSNICDWRYGCCRCLTTDVLNDVRDWSISIWGGGGYWWVSMLSAYPIGWFMLFWASGRGWLSYLRPWILSA